MSGYAAGSVTNVAFRTCALAGPPTGVLSRRRVLFRGVWILGDLAMAPGTLPNVLAPALLSGAVARESRAYFVEPR